MAFGGGGSGFSFGNSSNNNNATSTFGGFGNNSSTGFGSNTTTNTGFGASTTNTNPFGGGSSAFGSNTGGFGNNATPSTSLFGGNKSTTNPFGGGASTTSGLFGGSNNTNSGGFGGGSGGFGTSTNTNTTNTFGSGGNTGGGFTFGGSNTNKPAFGANTTSQPLFGQGGAGTTGGFGNASSPFGGSGAGTALNQPVPPCEGTGSTPFSVTTEKESNGTTNNYQSITFQQPYQKYSFEELRLADYNAGRRFGNASGQAGAFGASSFGGFGSNNATSGTFGNTNTSTNTNTNPFGGATNTSTGFGGNTTTSGFGGSGGLFGNANKPGGLFGNSSTSAAPSGGLFGTSNTTTTNTFGSGNNAFGGNQGTGGLFGNTNQNKPASGLFGNTASNTTGSLFGNTNNTNAPSGGLFGNTANTNTGSSGGLFGSTNTNTNTSSGLFGNTNANQGNSLFGNKSGSAFGANATQGQSGGLFGNTNNNPTNGGLFGNTNNNTNAGGTGLFGNTNNNAGNTGGLFGNANTNNNQQKPLFGSTFGNNATNNTGGLFGNANNNNQQQPQQQSGGLFGNANSSGGLFGNSANKATPSLFGATNANQASGGLFSSTNTNSIFGNSQNQPATQQQQQQDGVRHASLLDPNPYGQSSIWTGLPPPTPENAKPVFTPLTATQKMKESMMKPPPSLRLNQSRYMTPPRRNGFGFSYSTYGTPNSAASTPGGAGLSGSMYGSRGFSGGSFGRSFNKSASVSNLRSQFNSDADDIWKRDAFTSTHRNSGGSIKRLTIDRSIRNDLFSRPSLPALTPAVPNGTNQASSGASLINGETHSESTNKLKKSVSFEKGTTGGTANTAPNGESGALVRTETDEDDEVAASNDSQGTRANGEGGASRGKELAAVPEDRASDHVSSRPAPDVQAKIDPKPGDYWMRPSRAETSKMPREKLQRFKNFQVGRYGCGQVTFNDPVDLTALPLDDLYEKIVEIRLRSITVYPDASAKPPVGKGLNVPSTISIENSWPRSRNQPSSATSGPIFDKHVNRLKKMNGTEFVDYEIDTGVWTFRVPHYTRYGLDYDDDDDTENMSELSSPPDSIEKSADQSAMEVDPESYENSADEDDTFAFKQKIIPGGFGKQSLIDYEPAPSAPVEDDEGSEQSAYSEDEMSEDEPSIVGSYPNIPALDLESPTKPVLKAGRAQGTPQKPLLDLEGDWAEQLQRTISPRKQNREILRDAQSKVLLDRTFQPIKPRTTIQKEFRTSIDVMNSLFSQHEQRRASSRKQAKDSEPEFEFPYAKRAKTFDPDADGMNDADKKFHDSFKAQFTGMGELIFKKSGGQTAKEDMTWGNADLLTEKGDSIVKSALDHEVSSFDLSSALESSEAVMKDGLPLVQHQSLPFSYIKGKISRSSNATLESDLYEVAHVLFDDYEDEFTLGLSHEQCEKYIAHIRHDRLTRFLSSYVLRVHGGKISRVEKENLAAAALLRLSAKDIKGACDSLQKVKNLRLMLLVAQIEHADSAFQDDVKAQIDAWREQNALSEMTDDIRALYELCAGNVTICQGKSQANVPVEHRAKTFAISEEFGLDWIQTFALGFWYGREEKRATGDGEVVTVETAVREFSERCESGLESGKPHDDPMWVLLKLYASLQDADRGEVPIPLLPQALANLNMAWDASQAFRLYHAIVAKIDGDDERLNVDIGKADELAGLLAWQLSSKEDVAGAIYALLHLSDANKREEMIKALLERYAGKLPDPPASALAAMGAAINVDIDTAVVSTASNSQEQLWFLLTQRLLIPSAWIFQAKALHARASENNNLLEFQYLILAQSWTDAHDCLVHRVAPVCIVDTDYELLHRTTAAFDNVQTQVSEWDMGGGVYADFATLVLSSKNKNKGSKNVDASLIEGLRKRLVELGRRFSSLNGDGKQVDLGKLPAEELEERVAIKEMSGIVAVMLSDIGGVSRKDILELPITSDLRLNQTVTMAVEYYRGSMAGGHASGVTV